MSGSTHWLTGAAARAGLGTTDTLAVAPDTPAADAWREVAERAGVDEGELAEAVARGFHLEVADLDEIEAGARTLVPEEVARKHSVLPLRSSDRELVVATSEPLDFDTERELGFVSSRNVSFQVAPPAALHRALNEAYAHQGTAEFVVTNLALDEAEASVELLASPERSDQGELLAKTDPVAKLTNLILLEAVRAQAADVLIEPAGHGGRVRFRGDEELRTFLRIPAAALSRVQGRLAALADIVGQARTEPRRGRFRARIEGIPHVLRLVAVAEGQTDRMLLRVLDPDAARKAGEDVVPEPTATASRRRTALVVDDDAMARLLMISVLEKVGFDAVEEAPDGEAALRTLQDEEDVAIMLLDLMMPKMDGEEVLRRVRASGRTHGLPVVVITGSERPEDEDRLLRAGADDYLHKPIEPALAARRVSAVLRRHGMDVAGSATP